MNSSRLFFSGGIGGSSRHIARKYASQAVEVDAITLSPEQARRGNVLSQGLPVTLRVADAMRTPFADAEFDLVWSLESGEHMPDKPQFVNELSRLCKPGGTISLVTWCHRELLSGQSRLRRIERWLLGAVNYCYFLPKWCSGGDYQKLFAAKKGVKKIQLKDWTENIAAFWPAVARSSMRPSSLVALAKTGLKTIRGAVAIFLMILGYNLGTIKFVALSVSKE